MLEIRRTLSFDKWFRELDKVIRKRVAARILRIECEGHFRVTRCLGDGLFELKWKKHGMGHIRIYYTIIKNTVVLLISGGEKSDQKRDIEKAKAEIKNFKF